MVDMLSRLHPIDIAEVESLLGQTMRTARHHACDGVRVWKFDRFARNYTHTRVIMRRE
jgi:hypothetical protein